METEPKADSDATVYVRNLVFNPQFMGVAFEGLCRQQGDEGYELVRIVAVTNYQAVAVFVPHSVSLGFIEPGTERRDS